MAMVWERKSPGPDSWRSSAAGNLKWDLYRGRTKQYRILLCVLSNGGDPAAVFAVFLDTEARRAILLPADLTESALLFATQDDVDLEDHERHHQIVVFNQIEPEPILEVTSFSFDALPATGPVQHGRTHKLTRRDSQRLAAESPVQIKTRRLCRWCQKDMIESRMHLCGFCHTSIYCSHECLMMDWNRGLHPIICRDRALVQSLPIQLKIYRQTLNELGPRARQMVNDL